MVPNLHLGRSAQVLWGARAGPDEEALALRELTAYLTAFQAEHARARQMRLALSGLLCRWASVPWREGLGGMGDLSAWAAASLARQYGDAAAGWHVAIAPGRYGVAQVACATPAALLPAVDRLCAALGLEVADVSPLATAVFNALRRRLPPGSGALAIVEAECVVVVSWMGRDVVAVQSLGGSKADPLSALGAWRIRRELAGEAFDALLVTGCPPVKLEPAERWRSSGWQVLEFPQGLVQRFDASVPSEAAA